MLIGFMRNFKHPPDLAKLTAMLCNYHGIELIYIRPPDVNMNTKKVEGKMLINNKWINVHRELPPFIDITQYCFKRKYKEIINYLRKNTILSYDKGNTLNKEKLQQELLKDDECSHFVIPTLKVHKFSDIEKFINKHKVIVMKPIRGERGRGIFILKKHNKNYMLGHQKEEKVYSSEEFKDFYDDHIKNKRYIIQKYISSRTIQGDPFDCRIHIQKGQQGKWIVVKKFIRIGIGQQVISNVNQGGGISEVKPFLKANFGEKWQDIAKKLDDLALILPNKIEEIKKAPIMTIGLDIGIDSTGKVYLFESNGEPTTKPLLAESAKTRTEYYKYVIEHKLKSDQKTGKYDLDKHNKNTETEMEELQEKYNLIKKEKDLYKKKYFAIENSTSWKVTKPVRVIGNIVKSVINPK
ncbi:YheC/YheD family protein [Oceanobacillus halotolerans]|uniref:YheC/YheD family protein n=1 Tax=Oceanobacillus halotolerans TaxID=2663380 RepID=UPI0013DB9FD9|nr:YheC/YheD family protein [Oceanobacillus halotolerans]